MEIKRVISFILRIPLHLFLLGSFAASIYAAYENIQGITWGTPILFGIILAAWYIGVWMSKEEGVMGDVAYR
jgi:uncharacterized membrane protein (DUF485 family)